jgi:hypothetical protein
MLVHVTQGKNASTKAEYFSKIYCQNFATFHHVTVTTEVRAVTFIQLAAEIRKPKMEQFSSL